MDARLKANRKENEINEEKWIQSNEKYAEEKLIQPQMKTIERGKKEQIERRIYAMVTTDQQRD